MIEKSFTEKRRDRNWLGAGLVCLLLCLGMTFSANAGPRDGLRASKPLPQQDVVTAVDTAAGTVSLGGVVYRVGERTRLLDANGRPMSMRELVAAEEGQMVEFVARKSKKRSSVLELRKLQILEGDFE